MHICVMWYFVLFGRFQDETLNNLIRQIVNSLVEFPSVILTYYTRILYCVSTATHGTMSNRNGVNSFYAIVKYERSTRIY